MRTAALVALGLLTLACVAPAGATPEGALRQLSGRDGCVSQRASEQCRRGRALAVPSGLAVSPDGRHVYVASFKSDAVSVLRRDARTGRLRQLPGTRGCVSSRARDGDGCARARGLSGANAIAISHDGRNVYVASIRSTVAVLARDPATGTLTQAPGAAGCVAEPNEFGPARDHTCAPGRALTAGGPIVVSGDDRNVYVSSATGVAVLARDAISGALSQLAGPDGCLTSAEPAIPGERPDPTNPNCATEVFVQGSVLALSPDGATLYVGGDGGFGVEAFARDPATGALSPLTARQRCVASFPGDGECVFGRGMLRPQTAAVSPDGRSLHIASETAITSLRRDPATGALSILARRHSCVAVIRDNDCRPYAALSDITALAVSADSWRVYVAAQSVNAVNTLRRTERGGLRALAGRARCVAQRERRGCRRARGLLGVGDLALSPDGRHLYTAAGADRHFGRSSHAVAVFRVAGARPHSPPSTSSASSRARHERVAD